METIDAVIVGSGPAGYTAATYLARAQVETLVLEGPTPGGALTGTTEVENFPGFPDGIDGPELVERMRRQAGRYGAELRAETALALECDDAGFLVRTSGGTILARALILATGSTARTLGLPREEHLTGRGVSSCATCDGFFFRGQEVAVVGGGDSAMEEALFLTRFASTVHLIHRRPDFRASPIMAQRVLTHPGIRIHAPFTVSELAGADALEGLVLEHAESGDRAELAVAGLFVAIGHDPQSELLLSGGRPMVALDPTGHVRVEGRSARTGVPGLFACGDVVDPVYRQAATAAGSGCAAALDAQHYLTNTQPNPGPLVAAAAH